MKSNGTGHPKRGQRHERTFQEYLAIVMRGKWLALSIFALCVLAALVFSLVATPTFRATSTVLIDQKMAYIGIGPDGTPMSGARSNRNDLEVLKSRSIADTVAARLLLQKYLDPAAREVLPILLPEGASGEDQILPSQAVTGLVLGSVDFEPMRETDVIKITVSRPNGKEAALIANLYAQAFFDRSVFHSRARSRALREFLEAQLRDKRQNLDSTETALQQYMETQGIVSLDEESRKTIEQLAGLEAARDAADISIKSLDRKLESYRTQFPQVEADVTRMIGEGDDQYIRGLQQQIANLEVTRDVTVAQNPAFVGQEVYAQKLREIDDQIAALRGKLQERTGAYVASIPAGRQTGGGLNDPASSLKQLKQNIFEDEIEKQSLEAKRAALNTVIRQYSAQFERIPRKSIEFARLQRTKLSNEKLFLMVEAKFNEVAIAERSEFGNVTIVDPAVPPGAPSSPKLPLNILIGAFLGLVLGVGAVFAREHLDVKVQAPEDLKKKGHTVLAAVMVMDDEIRRLTSDGEAGKYGREVDAHLLTLLAPFSPISEAYRLLRTALHSPRSTTPPQAVLVTSPSPGEGKTTTVGNLAVTFAQTGKRVLIVDCDLRKPNLHHLFGLEPKPGLSELLFKLGQHEHAIRTGVIRNLDVITAGALSPNPSEVLGSREMAGFLEQAKREYDIILLDASPVLAATDASVVSTIADAVVLVVSAGATRMVEMDRAVEMLEGVGGKIIGLVVNRLDLQKAYGIPYGRSGYGYYGYSYHAAGKNGGERKKARRMED